MSYRPGQLVPTSGQYAVIDPYGRNTGYEVTAVKGEHFPPTSSPGYSFRLADRTKHRG
ncbi:hypothetical protein NIES2109_17820 [Nostoc sp. HK-01]|nr:hypothetical protein NIES2109_17820 [Nostoc sp. HK-01]